MKSIEEQFLDLLEIKTTLEEIFPKEEIESIRNTFRNIQLLADDLNSRGIDTTDFVLKSLSLNEIIKNKNETLNQTLINIKRADEEIVGKFLVAFLKLEFLINKLFEDNFEKFEISNSKKKSSSFTSKINYLIEKKEGFRKLLDLILCLKDIRNNIAHDITFDFESYENKALTKYLTPTYFKHDPKKTKLEIIIDLTDYVCGRLLIEFNK